MIQKTDTWGRLAALSTKRMVAQDLTKNSLYKVRDTTDYSMRQDPTQDKQQVLHRCKIAIMAEQLVADTVFGYLPSGNENHENPWSFAYDVVAKDGVRIEVKTHQAKSKWINVNTGPFGQYPGTQGINLGPFLDHRLADIIIIFDTKPDSTGAVLLTPKIMAGPQAFRTDAGLVQKSNYDNGGYYLRTCNPENYPFHQFTKQI